MSGALATPAALARWCMFLQDNGGDTWGALGAVTALGPARLVLRDDGWTVRIGGPLDEYGEPGRFTAAAFSRCPMLPGTPAPHGGVKALLDEGWIPGVYRCRADGPCPGDPASGRLLYWYNAGIDTSLVHWAPGRWTCSDGRLSRSGPRRLRRYVPSPP